MSVNKFLRGFSTIEIIVTMGILAVMAALSIPAYRQYQIRSDLNTAAEHISQALGRARILSVTGEGDDVWGVRSGSGILFHGSTFATRDASYDESFPIPPTIAVTGLAEVTFTRLLGYPSATGTIILHALSGYERTIDIELSKQGIPTTFDDRLMACHKPGTKSAKTKRLPDSAWPAHQKHGDHLGACSADDCDDSDEERCEEPEEDDD